MNCVRGCTSPRRHAPPCIGDDCDGCEPRKAEYGRLCYSCHARLRSHLEVIHGQWVLLEITAGKSFEQVLAAETTARPSNFPRVSSDGKFSGPWAHMAAASAAKSEPVRVAAMDAADALADWLSERVEHIMEAHNAMGPRPLRATEMDPRRWKWHPFDQHGRPATRYDRVTIHRDTSTHEEMRGQYILTDPPARFAVDTAANWLRAWLDRFEELETVGDDMESLNEVMSQAHALAPWREQVARLKGIPCPECGRRVLVRFGGDEDVSCLHCRTMIPPSRYLLWVRMLVDENGSASDPDDGRGSPRAGGDAEHGEDACAAR